MRLKTLQKGAMRSIDSCGLIGSRLGATPVRQLRGRRVPKVQWSFETSRCRSTLVRRVRLGISKRGSPEGRRASRGPDLRCLRGLAVAGTPPLGPDACKSARALVVGRPPVMGSQLTRPCLIRGRPLRQRRCAHGPVGALVHFGPAAPARCGASGLLPQQLPTATLRAQVVLRDVVPV